MKKYRLKQEVKQYFRTVLWDKVMTLEEWKSQEITINALEEIKEVLTYEDVARKIFEHKRFASTNEDGVVTECVIIGKDFSQPNNAKTTYQLECLMASNMLTNVANYLNEGYEFEYGEGVFFLRVGLNNEIEVIKGWYCKDGTTYFKTYELTQQVTEILGEETTIKALTKNF